MRYVWGDILKKIGFTGEMSSNFMSILFYLLGDIEKIRISSSDDTIVPYREIRFLLNHQNYRAWCEKDTLFVQLADIREILSGTGLSFRITSNENVIQMELGIVKDKTLERISYTTFSHDYNYYRKYEPATLHLLESFFQEEADDSYLTYMYGAEYLSWCTLQEKMSKKPDFCVPAPDLQGKFHFIGGFTNKFHIYEQYFDNENGILRGTVEFKETEMDRSTQYERFLQTLSYFFEMVNQPVVKKLTLKDE